MGRQTDRNGPAAVSSGHSHLLLNHKPDRKEERKKCGEILTWEIIELLPPFAPIHRLQKRNVQKCKKSKDITQNTQSSCDNKVINLVKEDI
jgi:hypothetical protein